MPLDWINEQDELSPAGLTVRAQVLDPTDNGQLRYAPYFPVVPVDSVDMSDAVTIDDRPAADRREWNASGRLIPVVTPEVRKVSMVPIEARDKINEREMQRLTERAMGNADIFRNLIGVRIPDRSDRLAMSCFRRHEVDCFQAWLQGTVTQRNPEDASKTHTASFGFDAGRYQTAATAWNDGGVNAYDEFIAWVEDGISEIGAVAGAGARRATINAILADAPDLVGGVSMSRGMLNNRLTDDLGFAFQLVEMEHTVGVFTDGGTATAATNVWTAQRVALIPAGVRVGSTAAAPVARAYEIAQIEPDARIDVRGVTVYHNAHNNGKSLDLEAQLNWLGIPDEQLMWVINAGV